ncbi:hypothetical protein Pmar_PMAR020213, partial [Perkinsus marinus ATCC 50983]
DGSLADSRGSGSSIVFTGITLTPLGSGLYEVWKIVQKLRPETTTMTSS